MSEFKCSIKSCDCMIDSDDWDQFYGMCAEHYGLFAPKKLERLEKLEKAIEQHKFIQSCISKSIGQELSQTDKDLYSVFDKEQGK